MCAEAMAPAGGNSHLTRGTLGLTEMVSGGSHGSQGSATSQVTAGAWADVMGLHHCLERTSPG